MKTEEELSTEIEQLRIDNFNRNTHYRNGCYDTALCGAPLQFIKKRVHRIKWSRHLTLILIKREKNKRVF